MYKQVRVNIYRAFVMKMKLFIGEQKKRARHLQISNKILIYIVLVSFMSLGTGTFAIQWYCFTCMRLISLHSNSSQIIRNELAHLVMKTIFFIYSVNFKDMSRNH